MTGRTEGISRFISESQVKDFEALGYLLENHDDHNVSLAPARLIRELAAGTMVGTIMYEDDEGKISPLALVFEEDLCTLIELIYENGQPASLIVGKDGVSVDATTAYGDSVVHEATKLLEGEA